MNVYPLSFSIPDECIISYSGCNNKHVTISDLYPGNMLTYRFGCDDEKEYNEHYQDSFFAYTFKKGGWDCMRHYEILLNGCLPIFKDLDKCPVDTLTTMPKQLIKEYNLLLPFKKEKKHLYDEYAYKINKWVKEKCSTSASANYFLSKVKSVNVKNILLIRGHVGVNYSRETLWIGLKRYIQSISGVAVEYPKINYLYKSYKESKEKLHGFGFQYTCRLDDDYNLSDQEIIDKIDNNFWDIIIYGKVGPDELFEGSYPNLPLWNHILPKYTKDQIFFIYGGDECVDLTYDNKYSQHIKFHENFGHCFVRELKR